MNRGRLSLLVGSLVLGCPPSHAQVSPLPRDEAGSGRPTRVAAEAESGEAPPQPVDGETPADGEPAGRPLVDGEPSEEGPLVEEDSAGAAFNPYDSDQLNWVSDSRRPPPPAPATEQPAEPVTGHFEEAPVDTVEDTGHVVPTSGWTDSVPGDAPPFSVGGVTATLSEDTWFKFYGFLQTRYVSGQHESPEEGRVAGAGFSLARARLFYYGRLTDWLRVLVRLGATSDGTARFEQAFADFRFKAFTFRVGQFNLPTFREQSLSPVSLQALDFSAVGSVFDGGQTQGVRVSWDVALTRLHLFLTDGFRTGFSEAGDPKVADLAFSTRFETLLFGKEYGQFDTGSSFRGDPASLLLGLGLHYQSGGALEDDAVEMGSMNADLTFECDGLSLSTSLSVMNTEGASGQRIDNLGLVTQGGVFLLPRTEAYGRYEVIVSTANQAAQQSLFRGVTVGVSQYVWPERGIRAVADFVYYFDPTLGTAVQPNPNAGLFESVGPQWTGRIQFNVLF